MPSKKAKKKVVVEEAPKPSGKRPGRKRAPGGS